MQTVYVIGGMGAGKSTVTSILAAQGVPVINMDDLGHQVLRWPSVKERLSDTFGEDVVDASGNVDRALLAERSFDCALHTEQLNAIVQTAVRDLYARLRKEYCDQGAQCVIVECSAFRSRNEEMLGDDDFVVAVCAPESTRVARAKLSGWDSDDIARRMARQITDDCRRAIADFVIENDGSAEQLSEKVLCWWNRFYRETVH